MATTTKKNAADTDTKDIPTPPDTPPQPALTEPEQAVSAPLAPDAIPILAGYEGVGTGEYVTVYLTSGSEADASPYRIAKTPELPLALAHGGARYLISDHGKRLYVWQVK